MTDGVPARDELSSERDRGTVPASSGSPWVRRGLAAAVVVALAAVVGPNLVAGGDAPERPRPEPSASREPLVEATPAPRPLSPLLWPVRGDLAGDSRFAAAALAAARERTRAAEKVLYAATLPDGSRLALVAASDQPASGYAYRGAAVQALHVPVGAEPAASRHSFAGSVASPDDLAGWAGHGRGGEVFAVLLGRPVPLEAQVSSAILYTKVGTASRSWQSVSSRDGSAIVRLGRDTDPLVVARTPYGENTYPLLMTVDGDLTEAARDAVAARVTVEGLDGSYRGPPSAALLRAVVDGTWVLFDPRRADVRVVWSGLVGGGQRGALLRMRRPDGATFQLFALQDEGGGTFAQGLRHVPWADGDVVPWVLETGQTGAPLLLVNPSGAGTALVSRLRGEEPLRVRIGRNGLANLGGDQGVAMRRLSGAALTVLSPSGRELVETEWAEFGESDPFVVGAS